MSEKQGNNKVNNKIEEEKKMELNEENLQDIEQEENTEIVTDIENFEEEIKKIDEQININYEKIKECENEKSKIYSLNDVLRDKRIDLIYNKIEKIFKESELKEMYRIEKTSDSDFAIYEIPDLNNPEEEWTIMSGEICHMTIIFEMLRKSK